MNNILNYSNNNTAQPSSKINIMSSEKHPMNNKIQGSFASSGILRSTALASEPIQTKSF
jgi:hypothetical protein